MKALILWSCLALFFSFQGLQAQKARVTQVWDKTFGGNGDDITWRSIPTNDGGFLFSSRSSSTQGGDKTEVSRGGAFDFWIVKTDANGNKLWDKSYGGTGDDRLHFIQPTTDGGFLLGGQSDSPISGEKSQTGNGRYDFWLVKINEVGNKVWDKVYGGNNQEWITGIVPTMDGGYLLCGNSNSEISGGRTAPSRGDYDYWVVKIDSLGNKIWDKAYGGSGADALNTATKSNDGGFYLAGWSESGNNGDKISPSFGQSDIWLLKIKETGEIIWQQSFGGNNHDRIMEGLLADNGDYLISAYSASIRSGNKSENNYGENDYWLLRIDPTGNKVWDKTFGGSKDDLLGGIALSSVRGNILLCGASNSPISGNKTQANRGGYDYWLIEIDSLGNKVWEQVYGSSGDDRSMAVVPANEKNHFLLVGYSNSPIGGEKSEASRGMNDFWVVNVSVEPNGINETASPKSSFSLYPNPATDRLTLYPTAITPEPMTVHLCDLTGKELQTLYVGTLAENGTEIEIKDRSAGIYLLQLRTVSGQTTTQKLILQP